VNKKVDLSSQVIEAISCAKRWNLELEVEETVAEVEEEDLLQMPKF
jgi:hypothetical protein